MHCFDTSYASTNIDEPALDLINDTVDSLMQRHPRAVVVFLPPRDAQCLCPEQNRYHSGILSLHSLFRQDQHLIAIRSIESIGW